MDGRAVGDVLMYKKDKTEFGAALPIKPGEKFIGEIHGIHFGLHVTMHNNAGVPIRVFGKVKALTDGENIIIKIRKMPPERSSVSGVEKGDLALLCPECHKRITYSQ